MDAHTLPFNDSDLLTPFEQRTLVEPYKGFYAAKRNNFFASLQGFPDLWDAFMRLNAIWMRESEDMGTVTETSKMFPLTLFMNGHVKMLVAIELGFSSCLTEAYSLIRDAIESVAHGNRVLADPNLRTVWFSKNDGSTAEENFKSEFWYAKEAKLFDGLPKLLKLWKRFSEIGAHTNLNSIVTRFVIEETPQHVTWKLNYTGVELRTLVPALFEILLVFEQLEEVLYKNFEARLKLDVQLTSLREKFQHEREALRRKIIRSFNIQPPSSAVP